MENSEIEVQFLSAFSKKKNNLELIQQKKKRKKRKMKQEIIFFLMLLYHINFAEATISLRETLQSQLMQKVSQKIVIDHQR